MGNSGSTGNEPIPASPVDLAMYTGTWYELARIPYPYEAAKAINVRATYTLNPDQSIQVVNTEEVGDVQRTAYATAYPVNPEGSKIKVYFTPGIGGDYWILETNYEYALVGDSDRSHGWILSRSKTMDYYTYGALLTHFSNTYGYNTNLFVPTKQT